MKLDEWLPCRVVSAADQSLISTSVIRHGIAIAALVYKVLCEVQILHSRFIGWLSMYERPEVTCCHIARLQQDGGISVPLRSAQFPDEGARTSHGKCAFCA